MLEPGELSRDAMVFAVTRGKAGTAMQSFSKVLSAVEIQQVVDFVRREFILQGNRNTTYHTLENGWPEHERYQAAFPFALGELALDLSWDALTPEQQAGKRLYMNSCISCHDRGSVTDEGAIWDARPLSYPRNNYSHQKDAPADGVSGASVYALHDSKPELTLLTAVQRRGESLFQANCAFCHAADGSGKNWIGSFLQPHPRDLTGARVGLMTDDELEQVIRDGLPGTTMSAWKNVLADSQIKAIVAYINAAFKSDKKAASDNN